MPPPRGFPPRQQTLIANDIQSASTVDKAHGRTEKRTIKTSTLLNNYLDWPETGQVFHLHRETKEQGKTRTEDVYGITSLTREQADADRLLALIRGHWAIENRLHYVRDVTLGEDACRVRKGASAIALAGIRNAAVTLLDRLNLASAAQAIRACALRPRNAFRLLFSTG